MVSVVYKVVIHFQTSAGTQLHGQEVEQVLGAVAHELYRSLLPSTMAFP